MHNRYYIDGRECGYEHAKKEIEESRECGYEKAGDGLPEIRVDVFPPFRGGEAPSQYIWDWKAEKWAPRAPADPPKKPSWQVNFDSPGVC